MNLMMCVWMLLMKMPSFDCLSLREVSQSIHSPRSLPISLSNSLNLVFGYPGTDGGIFSNYRQYVKNNHPLLSICLASPLNPFGRKERILVFLNSLFFAIFVTFLVTETTFVPKVDFLMRNIIFLFIPIHIH